MPAEENNLKKRYEACLVLSAIGDAIGYKNGDWEFNTSGIIIHQQYESLTKGKGCGKIKLRGWHYSDDTVMHMATCDALLQLKDGNDINVCGQLFAVEYKKCWKRMHGRSPGKTTGKCLQIIDEDGSNWNRIPFNRRGGGCGGAMRAMCIGICFEDIENIIAYSITSSCITHHHPTGFLGAFIAAYFCHLGLKNISINLWGAYFFQAIPQVKEFITNRGREVELNLSSFDYFIDQWTNYMNVRNLSMDIEVEQIPEFPEDYGLIQRDRFYRSVAFRGWGGASGHDSVMIAYDALLGCGKNWEEFVLRGILHGGDNDSTAAIGGAWFGCLYGFETVPSTLIKHIEDSAKLHKLGRKLYKKFGPKDEIVEN